MPLPPSSDVMTKIWNGSADVAIGHIPISYNYYQKVDFSPAYYPYEVRLLARKPRPLAPYLNVLKPFSFNLWEGGRI